MLRVYGIYLITEETVLPLYGNCVQSVEIDACVDGSVKTFASQVKSHHYFFDCSLRADCGVTFYLLFSKFLPH